MTYEVSEVEREQRGATRHCDVVVVGAGFAGLYALHTLRKRGYRVTVLEAGDGIGGTWYWNRYPGARCDIESMEYSYSFSEELQQAWVWPARYADQADILRYINHVADRFDLRRDIQLGTRVSSAVFDESTDRWTIRTESGERFSTRFCIMATGGLSSPNEPPFEGLDAFEGDRYHTAYWPTEPTSFEGCRVGVIGTGSSGIQAIPHLAKEAKRLTVFQRTPNFSIPAGNRPLTAKDQEFIRRDYADLRQRERDSDFGVVGLEPNPKRAMDATPQEREAEYERRWNYGAISFYTAFSDLLVDPEANETAAEFVRRKIRQKVRDPAVADLLIPQGYPFGAKRLCADTDYYETFNRYNVELVDIRRSPIVCFERTGLRTASSFHPLDKVVFATGFDALTGALTRIDIRGRGGERLGDKWSAGPRTLLGIMTAGFPNLFITTGPGSPSVLYNMVLGNEYHVEWISRCIDTLVAQDLRRIEPDRGAEDQWVEHVNAVGAQTLFPKANSWYMGANVPGKARTILLYLGGFRAYRDRCEQIAASGYEGFVTR